MRLVRWKQARPATSAARAVIRARARSFVLACGCLVVPAAGCGDDPPAGEVKHSDGGAPSDGSGGTRADGFPVGGLGGGAAIGGATGDAAGASSMGGTAGSGAPDAGGDAGDMGDASTSDTSDGDANDEEMAPDGSGRCGDGYRDPLTEECDDGANPDPADTCDDTCRIRDTLVEIGEPQDGPVLLPGRVLEFGRHPVASSDSGFAVAFVEEASPDHTLWLKSFSHKGVRGPAAIDLGVGSDPASLSSASVAGLPGGKYAVVWTDLSVDGDSLGIAFRIVDPAMQPTAPAIAANATKFINQESPDLIATDSEIVVAWLDTPIGQRVLKFRRFSFAGAPKTAADEILASGADAGLDVALARFASGWAASWGIGGTTDVIRIRAGSTDWSVPRQPISAGHQPAAMAEIDSTRLFVVFCDDVDTGYPLPQSRLRFAIADTAAPGTLASLPIDPKVEPFASDPTIDQRWPSVVRSGSDLYVAWRSGDWSNGSPDVWIKRIPIVPLDGGVTLDLSELEVLLPRLAEHRTGRQELPALAAWSGTLFAAWEDYGRSYGPGERAPDVVVQVLPTPFLRLGANEAGR